MNADFAHPASTSALRYEVSDGLDCEDLRSASEFLERFSIGMTLPAVYVAAELQLADLLANGPRNVHELADATGAHASSLHRLLRALASLDFCSEREDGSFALNPLGSLLQTNVRGSLRSWTLWWGRYQWPLWGSLLYSVKTGESARKLVTGADGFGQLERDADAAAIFNHAMAEYTRLVATGVTRAYDFSEMRRIVDVGGGYGALLAAVLEAHPGARGVVFDLSHAIEGARANLASAGLAQRCEFVAGDFFDSVPEGCDAYVLKAVIHDWDDERSAVILRNCRRAIPHDGKLLLVERIMPGRLEALPPHRSLARADLTMLIGPGGRERTEADFRSLLYLSGFNLTRIFATALEYSILEAVPR